MQRRGGRIFFLTGSDFLRRFFLLGLFEVLIDDVRIFGLIDFDDDGFIFGFQGLIFGDFFVIAFFVFV